MSGNYNKHLDIKSPHFDANLALESEEVEVEAMKQGKSEGSMNELQQIIALQKFNLPETFQDKKDEVIINYVFKLYFN